MLLTRFLTTPEVLILGGLGCLVCCVSAMLFRRGYQRGVVGVSVFCILFGALTPWFALLMTKMETLFFVLALIGGCMALATVFLVPVLMVAGLCEQACPWKTKLAHAAWLVAAWTLGIGCVFLHFIDGLH